MLCIQGKKRGFFLLSFLPTGWIHISAYCKRRIEMPDKTKKKPLKATAGFDVGCAGWCNRDSRDRLPHALPVCEHTRCIERASSAFQQTESAHRKQRVMLLRGADVFPFEEGEACLAESLALSWTLQFVTYSTVLTKMSPHVQDVSPPRLAVRCDHTPLCKCVRGRKRCEI